MKGCGIHFGYEMDEGSTKLLCGRGHDGFCYDCVAKLEAENERLRVSTGRWVALKRCCGDYFDNELYTVREVMNDIESMLPVEGEGDE